MAYRVTRKLVDVLLKSESQALVSTLPQRLGVVLPPIAAQLPTERPRLDIHLEELDVVFQLADESILHLEFQTTRKRQDLSRFARYDLVLYDHYQQPVHTVVIYGADIGRAADTLEGGSFRYRVNNVYLGEQDGELALTRVREQFAQRGTLDEEARLDLVLLPLMRHRRPLKDVLRDAVSVARQLEVDAQRSTLAALLGFGFRYLEQEQVETLVEDLMQTVTGLQLLEQSYQRGLQEGREEGLQEGREKGRAQGLVDAKREDVLTTLGVRFNAAPEVVRMRLENIKSLDRLSTLFTLALGAATLEEFMRTLE